MKSDERETAAATNEHRSSKGIRYTDSIAASLCILVFSARLLNALPTLSLRPIAVSVVALVFSFLPPFLTKKGTRIPVGIWVVYYLFLFCTLFLGEMLDFYTRFPFWDSALHLLSGFCFSAIGLGLFYSLFRKQPGLWGGIVFIFCFSMTMGVLWECYEFGCDQLFRLDMQRDTVLKEIASRMIDNGEKVMIHAVTLNGKVLPGYIDPGLHDTMHDQLWGAGGTIGFILIFWFSRVKSRKCRRLLNAFVPRFGA